MLTEENILKKIQFFPDELVNYIKEFIPNRIFVFTCKKYYFLYHHLIKKHINDYENYVRETIRRDNYFVFKLIIEENIKKWIEVKHYKYKNMIFKNYLYFTISYCIDNESNSCRNILTDFLKIHGLHKNLHKKNIVKYIKWKI
jgi:hypothetical protein